jgi:plasmid stabilization system protein ParE
MSGYILAPLAAQDLDDLWEFIASNNLDAADRIIYHPETSPLEIVRILRGSRDIPSLI